MFSVILYFKINSKRQGVTEEDIRLENILYHWLNHNLSRNEVSNIEWLINMFIKYYVNIWILLKIWFFVFQSKKFWKNLTLSNTYVYFILFNHKIDNTKNKVVIESHSVVNKFTNNLQIRGFVNYWTRHGIRPDPQKFI